MEFMSRYFRLEIEGGEHIPRRGPFILTPNHSGFSGFDAMVLSHQIRKISGRLPRVLTHKLWFMTEATKIPAQKLGFIEASMSNGLNVLKKNQPIVIFPEGEHGNFKPTLEAYNLQEFKKGFVLMALKAEAPIVPTLIIGAEETHINLSKLKLPDALKGLIVPLPLNLVPLPAKWKIIFLPPIRLPYPATSIQDHELINDLADEIREKMQLALNRALQARTSIYF